MAERYSIVQIWNQMFDPENKVIRVKGDEGVNMSRYSLEEIMNQVFDSGQKRLRIASSVASYAGTTEPTTPGTGDVWYNPETGELKIYV